MWYIAQKTNNLVEVDLFDEIGGWGIYAKELKDELSSIIGNPTEEVVVNINSPGGSVFEGIEIYNYLKGLPNKVTVKINSLAASIATVIALGADELEISESAFFMIHNPWTMAGGESEDLRKQADVLDKIKETILNIYKKNSNLSLERLTSLMDEETWLTGSEALEYGFATRLTEGMNVAAMATTEIVNNFKNKPNSLQMAEVQEAVETVEEVTVEATEQVEAVETVEENIEEVVEDVTEEKESILNKVKVFLNNKLGEASNELSDRYGEVSNELKEAKEANADLSNEIEETRNVLEESYKAMNSLKDSIEAKELEIKELKAKLSETEGEELKPVTEVKNEVKTKMSFRDVVKNKLNK